MDGSNLSRRQTFKLAGLAGAAVALRNSYAPAQEAQKIRALPPRPLPQGAGFYRTMVGDFEVTVVSDGQFPLTPYPTFGSNASKEAVEKVLTDNFLDPANLMGQVNTLVVRQPGGPITLIDTGTGKLFGPAAGFLLQNLTNAGIRPEEVEHVIFTHLHPDHVGGVLNENGNLVFTNAKFHAHKSEVDFWTSEKPDFSKSGVPAEMQPVMIGAATKAIKAMGDKLMTFFSIEELEQEILPGIAYHFTPGHTPGHCTISIKSGDASLEYVADTIVQANLVLAHPEWFVGFDTDMTETAKSRAVCFELWESQRTLIAGSHLPFPSIGHIRKATTGYEFVPSPWRWA